jgi:hypothetical protein
MRYLPLLLAGLLLTGCATDETFPVIDLGPAATGNANTSLHIKKAQTALLAVPATPQTKLVGDELTFASTSAQQVQNALTVAQQEAVTDSQAREKLKAQIRKDVAQHEADQKAVTRRNYLLVLALFGGAFVFYAGEWAKLASPYTTLLPNVVAGMLAVMIVCVLSAFVISFWSGFGWLIHLF